MPPKMTAEEEKKAKLLHYMMESGHIFSNATIEQASKPTGISGMIIKQILQSLADEGLVDQEKVGASQFYWCFKSKHSTRVLAARDKVKEELEACKKESKSLEQTLAKLEAEKKKTDAIREMEKELSALQKEVREMQAKKESLEKFSYAQYEEIKKALQKIQEEANLETDNTFALRKYLVEKFAMPREMVNKQLGINDAFDYIE